MPNRQSLALAPASNPAIIRPEYIRLPDRGAYCPLTGLSRTMMETLIRPRVGHPPLVKSFSLSQTERGPGAKKGARLVNVESLLGYLAAKQREEDRLYAQSAPAPVAEHRRSSLRLKKEEAPNG